MVGLSDKPWRPSYGVALYLQDRGIRIVPINPNLAGGEVLGEIAYPSLSAIPLDVHVDVVDIFRRSELVGPIVDEAIARGEGAIWMQEGVVNDAAAAQARAAGLDVVMDACLAVEHRMRVPR